MSVDSDRADLPSHLTESDVRTAAAEADTLLDAQMLLRVGRSRTRKLLKSRGLLDDVRQAGPETLGRVRRRMGGDE